MTTPTTPSTGPARPRQVTMAAWLIMGGSVVVVLTVFERVAGLHSLETRQSVQKFLSEPPGADLGVGVTEVLSILRVLCMVAAGCATAAAILGYQVLQRRRSARVALTVLALPLFVTGVASGGFMSSLVAAMSVMLWFQPARDWFDGVVREPGAEQVARSSAQATGSSPWGVAPPMPRRPTEQAAPQAPGVIDPTARPAEVTLACTLTWVFAGLALVVMAASMVVLATSPGLVFDELHRQNPDLASQGVSDATLRTMTFVVGGVVIVWSLAALVVAVLAFRRVRWARTALVASASASLALLLLATLGQVLLVVPLAASVVTLALLVRPDVRAWYDR